MQIESAEKKTGLFRRRKKTPQRTEDDVLVLTTLEQLRADLAVVHQSLNTVTDPMLIDSCIYEMNAIHMKYQFYMKLCKSRGLVAESFEGTRSM